MKKWIIGPGLMVFLFALTVGVANATPTGNGVCYTTDGLCVAGQCDVIEGTDLYQALNGFNGVDGIYSISSACENGLELSNVIVQDGASCSVKAEYESGSLFPEIMITIVNGEPVTAFSKKCGTQCFVYGGDFLKCNEPDLP